MSEFGAGFHSGLGLENLRATEMNYHPSSKGASDENCTWLQVIGPSDHSHWVSINRSSSKKAYTERVHTAGILLSEIVNKFIISAILAV